MQRVSGKHSGRSQATPTSKKTRRKLSTKSKPTPQTTHKHSIHTIRNTGQHQTNATSSIQSNTLITSTTAHFSTNIVSRKSKNALMTPEEQAEYDNELVEFVEENSNALKDIAVEMQLFQPKPYREHILKIAENTEKINFTTLEQAALFDEKMILTDFHSYIDLKVHTQNLHRQKKLLLDDPDAVLGGKPPLPPLHYPHLRPNAWSLPPMLIPSMVENTIQEQASIFNSIADLSQLIHKYLSKHYATVTTLPPPILTFENTILAFETATQRSQHTRASLSTVDSLHPDPSYRNAASRASKRFSHMMQLEANNPTMRKVLFQYASSEDAQKLGHEERALTANVLTGIFKSLGLREYIWDDLIEDDHFDDDDDDVDGGDDDADIVNDKDDNEGKTNNTSTESNDEVNIKSTKKRIKKSKKSSPQRPGGIPYSQMATFLHAHVFLLDKSERGLSKWYDLGPNPAKNGPKPTQLLDVTPQSSHNTTETNLSVYDADAAKSSRQIYDELAVVSNHLALQHPLHAKYNKLLNQQNVILDQIHQIEITHSKVKTLLNDIHHSETVAEHQQEMALQQLKGSFNHIMAWVDGAQSITDTARSLGQDIGYFVSSTLERLQDPMDLLRNTLAKFRGNLQLDSFSHHRPRPLMQVTLHELEGLPPDLIEEFQKRNARYMTTKPGDDQSLLDKVIPGDDGTSHPGYEESPCIILGNSYEEYFAVMTFVHSDVVRYRFWTLYHHGSNNPYPSTMLPQLNQFRQQDLGLVPPGEESILDSDPQAAMKRAKTVQGLRQNGEHLEFEDDLFTIMLDLVVGLRSLLGATGEEIQKVKSQIDNDIALSTPDFSKTKSNDDDDDDNNNDTNKNDSNISGDDNDKEKSSTLPTKKATFLDTVAHNTFLHSPDNVKDFIDYLVDEAKRNINDSADTTETQMPHNVVTMIKVKQHMFSSQAFRGYRGGDLVRYLSMRRQYVDSEDKPQYTTTTLSSMTTPSLTGYELDHEILRIEALLLEQLNQQAVLTMEIKQVESQKHFMAEVLTEMMKGLKSDQTPEEIAAGDAAIEAKRLKKSKAQDQNTEILDEDDPVLDPIERQNRINSNNAIRIAKQNEENGLQPRKNSRIGKLFDEYAGFLESFGGVASEFLGATNDCQRELDSEISEKVTKLRQLTGKIDGLREDLRDNYIKWLESNPETGVNELTHGEREELKTNVTAQIKQRIRPTVTTLFPWERLYYSRLADPNNPTMQGGGTEEEYLELLHAEQETEEAIEFHTQQKNSTNPSQKFQQSLSNARQQQKKNKADSDGSTGNDNNNNKNVKVVAATTSVAVSPIAANGLPPHLRHLPPHHPMVRAQIKADEEARLKAEQEAIANKSNKKSKKSKTPETIEELNGLNEDGTPIGPVPDTPDEEEVNVDPTSFLPQLSETQFNLEIESAKYTFQNKLATFNIPYNDLEFDTYLPLPFVLHNLLFIFEELFHVDIIQAPTQYQIHPEDTKTLKSLPSMQSPHIHIASATNALIHDVWHRNVLAFNMYDRGVDGHGNSVTGEKPLLGTFYFDLHGRPGKNAGVEAQFIANSYRHNIFTAISDQTVSAEVFRNMKHLHSSTFFLNGTDIPANPEVLAEIYKMFEEIKDEAIVDEPEHKTHIVPSISPSSFSPETYQRGFETIRSVARTHYHTTFNPKQVPVNVRKNNTKERKNASSLSTTPLHLTTNARQPPVTILTFPFHDTQVLPPTHDLDQLIDHDYNNEIIKHRRTGLPASLLSTKTASHLTNKTKLHLEHASATVAHFKEVHNNSGTFVETLQNHFTSRRTKLAQLQNMPNLINSTKLPTTPVLLSLSEVKQLFHEFGHAVMHTLDHTPYLNAKTLLDSQEIQELVSHLAESFLLHSNPNKPQLSAPDRDEMREFVRKHKNGELQGIVTMKAMQEQEQASVPIVQITPAQANARLHALLTSTPNIPSFGPVHAITHHYSYLNHGDATHLFNMYHPDTQYLYKHYVQQLSQLIFPPNNPNAVINVLHGNNASNYDNVLDFRVFSQTVKYLSNYHNTKNAIKWKQKLQSFATSMATLDKTPFSSIQNEIGLGQPYQHQAAEFGIINDQSSTTQIETKLKNMMKRSGRVLHPNQVDTLIFHAVKKANIAYDERAKGSFAMLPHQAIELGGFVPTTSDERQKTVQKLFSRYPPKPPLSFFQNLLRRDAAVQKQGEHVNMMDAVLDYHLHTIEFVSDVNEPAMIRNAKVEETDSDSDDHYSNGPAQLEAVPHSTRMEEKAVHGDTGHQYTDASVVDGDGNMKQSKWTSANLNADPSSSSSSSSQDQHKKRNKSDPLIIDDVEMNEFSTMAKNALGGSQLSLDYFTSKIYNYDQFRAHFSNAQTPVQQLKERPLDSRNGIFASFTATVEGRSLKLQNEILAKQFEQRQNSTILIDRIRGVRERVVKDQVKRLQSVPPQRRPVDVSNQRLKYQLLLPQYMFLPHEQSRYNLGLSQAQGTTSMSNNIYRTLQFLLENQPVQDTTNNGMTKSAFSDETLLKEDPQHDRLGIKRFPPAIPTLPSYESIKPKANSLSHLYSSYAGQLYSYPYAEMLSSELFQQHFLTQTKFAQYNLKKNCGIIQQQRLNTLRFSNDPSFMVKSDISYELEHYFDLIKLSTSSPLTPHIALYGAMTKNSLSLHAGNVVSKDDQTDSNTSEDSDSYDSDSYDGDDDGITTLYKKSSAPTKSNTAYPNPTLQKQRPTLALPFGYYKSPYISKPTVAFVNQYYNIEKTKEFKHVMKLFQKDNVIGVLAQFHGGNIGGNNLDIDPNAKITKKNLLKFYRHENYNKQEEDFFSW